jgi:murein DD-endopeptidase MepM/ murein hydrolase activator NlpD
MGRDYGVQGGTPIYAAEGGTVVKGRGETAGIYVVVVGPDLNSYYFHMQASVVRNGQHVNAGDLLGFVGSTGHSTNPHLHFEQHSAGPVWGADGKVPKDNLIQPCTF